MVISVSPTGGMKIQYAWNAWPVQLPEIWFALWCSTTISCPLALLSSHSITAGVLAVCANASWDVNPCYCQPFDQQAVLTITPSASLKYLYYLLICTDRGKDKVVCQRWRNDKFHGLNIWNQSDKPINKGTELNYARIYFGKVKGTKPSRYIQICHQYVYNAEKLTGKCRQKYMSRTVAKFFSWIHLLKALPKPVDLCF